MITKEQIEEYIRKNRTDMIRELFLWVSQPSVSRPDLAAENAPFGPECRRMLTLALNRGKKMGFEAVDHEGYCGDLIYGNASEEFGVSCHLDVVPPGDGWIFDPFHPTEKDGFLIGRGIDDNKGSAILAVWAARFFMEHSVPLRKKLRIMLGCSEENGMHDFLHYRSMPDAAFPPLTIVPDAPFPVCAAQKGGWNAVIRIPAGKDIADLKAGTASLSQPGHSLLVSIDIRYPVSLKSSVITETFRNELAASGSSIDSLSVSDPYCQDPADPAAETLMKIYREATGRTEDRPYAMGGGTYSRVIPHAISFGPGLPEKPDPPFLPAGHGHPHGPDEALHIDSWLKCLEIYIRVIEAFAA